MSLHLVERDLPSLQCRLRVIRRHAEHCPETSEANDYARRLREDGYAIHSGFVQLRLLGCFNLWLHRKGLTSEDVDATTIERYVRGRAQSRKLRRGDSAALLRLLTMLRPEGSGVTAPLPIPVEAALEHFQQYLRQERSLSEATVINYTPVARSFLSERFPRKRPSPRRLPWPRVTHHVGIDLTTSCWPSSKACRCFGLCRVH